MAASAHSYEDLLAAGVSETDVLRILKVPTNMPTEEVERLLLTQCGGDVTEELATLVTARNELLLQRFPSGELRESLKPETWTWSKTKMAWYARRDQGVWMLVDARYRAEALFNREEASIGPWLAAELGVDLDALEELGAGRTIADEAVELALLSTRAWRADICENPWDDLSIANDRALLFLLTTFPLIPPGHVTFLMRYYAPLLMRRSPE